MAQLVKRPINNLPHIATFLQPSSQRKFLPNRFSRTLLTKKILAKIGSCCPHNTFSWPFLQKSQQTWASPPQMTISGVKVAFGSSVLFRNRKEVKVLVNISVGLIRSACCLGWSAIMFDQLMCSRMINGSPQLVEGKHCKYQRFASVYFYS